MISVTNLRPGVTFEDQGNIFQVLTYDHIKMGRGSGTIKVKVKNLRSGATHEKSFITGAKVKEAPLAKKKFQYLYKDRQNAVFMDTTTFEQMEISLTKIAYEHEYLKEGMEVSISFHNEEPLSLDLPIKMEFLVMDAGSSARGNTQTNVFKDVTLENGLIMKAPLFIKTGEKIVIDTRTGSYVERGG